jgi:hypothetical protein
MVSLCIIESRNSVKCSSIKEGTSGWLEAFLLVHTILTDAK